MGPLGWEQVTSLLGRPKKRTSRVRREAKKFQSEYLPLSQGATATDQPSTWALQFPMQHGDLLAGDLSLGHRAVMPRSTAPHQRCRPTPTDITPTMQSCPHWPNTTHTHHRLSPENAPRATAPCLGDGLRSHSLSTSLQFPTSPTAGGPGTEGLMVSSCRWPKDTSHPDSGSLASTGERPSHSQSSLPQPPLPRSPGQPSVLALPHSYTSALSPNPARDGPTCTQRDMHTTDIQKGHTQLCTGSPSYPSLSRSGSSSHTTLSPSKLGRAEAGFPTLSQELHLSPCALPQALRVLSYEHLTQPKIPLPKLSQPGPAIPGQPQTQGLAHPLESQDCRPCSQQF